MTYYLLNTLKGILLGIVALLTLGYDPSSSTDHDQPATAKRFHQPFEYDEAPTGGESVSEAEGDEVYAPYEKEGEEDEEEWDENDEAILNDVGDCGQEDGPGPRPRPDTPDQISNTAPQLQWRLISGTNGI